jgi:3-hydroxyacyl-[acyl-carrier-protein] dehydratase
MAWTVELNAMDIRDILELLPHRYPFLLVDRIIECDPPNFGVGIKCVTVNEPHMQGHFPGRPLMPGVLILEHQAQVGGVVLLASEQYRGSFAMLAGVESARFRRQVVPGDVLRTEFRMIKARAMLGRAEVTTTVEDQLVCKSEILFALEGPPKAEAPE